MATDKNRKVATDGGSFSQQIDLSALGDVLPAASRPAPPVRDQTAPVQAKVSNKGRLEMRRETAGRGGKTVTTVKGTAWTLASQRQREALFTSIRRQCACGGKLTSDGFELQGDHRDAAEQALEAAGFRVVRAGG